MRIESFSDYEVQPCKLCGTPTVCLFMLNDQKIFICEACVTKASLPRVTTGRKDGSGNREE